MLKLVGAVVVMCACTLCGLRAADELSSRARLLEEFALAVQVLERELSLFRPPLPSLLERMAHGRCKQVVSALEGCGAGIERGICFTDAWEEQLEKLPLTPQENSLLRGLGQVLGRYDDRGQVQAAARIREELEACAVRQRQDSRTKGRMYRVLGAAFGGFLVLALL